jgi:hypothetical protein
LKGLTSSLLSLLIALTFSETRPAFGYGIGTDSPGLRFSLTGCGLQGKDFIPVHRRAPRLNGKSICEFL